MAKVLIGSEVFESLPEERLSDLLIRTGRTVPMPCGGNGSCGKCLVAVNGESVRACRYVIRSDIEVVLPDPESILSETTVDEDGDADGPIDLVLDIGTTTLALAAVSKEPKKIVRVAACPNPQRAFGADVMSRIAYCAKNGPDALRETVLGAVKSLIKEIGSPDAENMYVAGNTTMLHLFWGVDCSSMGAAPYTPVFLDSVGQSGEELELLSVGHVESLPSAAAFVGADLTAGLNYVGFPPEGKKRLLVDLGTNAEVILFSKGKGLCTAAAAGPCFEGANISCGMCASPGAISAYSAEGWSTIGGEPAVGVCGTGLVDVIATLLEDGTIDETGFMEDDPFEIAPGVFLTREDVRKYQLAKSAVCSAIQALLRRGNVGYDDVDALYISGGFSTKIDIDNAVKTGLLPPELKDKCVPVGNSSLLGAVKYALEKNQLSVYLDGMEYVDLASDKIFSDLFIENMMFEGDG